MSITLLFTVLNQGYKVQELLPYKTRERGEGRERRGEERRKRVRKKRRRRKREEEEEEGEKK